MKNVLARAFGARRAPAVEQTAYCSVCEEPQFDTPSGPACANGHGGAPSSTLPPDPGVPPPHVDWVTVADTYLWTYANEPELDRKQGIFHPSAGLHEDCGNCKREIIFDMIHATRGRKNNSAKMHKVFQNGKDRHRGLQEMFAGMAKRQYMGIIHYEPEKLAVHPTLPIGGRADGFLVMQDGHRYLHDYKTMGPDEWLKTFEPSFKHKVQLNTYQGCLQVRAGYLIVENKKGQDWATPMNRFRVNFDAMLFQETEQFCIDILHTIAAEKLPAFDEAVCKKCVDFCQYQAPCKAERSKMAKFSTIDKRPADVKRRHLEVIQ